MTFIALLALTLAGRPRAAPCARGARAPLRMGPLPWGKRPCRDYVRSVRAQSTRRLADGVIEVHPLAHLRWTLPPDGVSARGDSAPPPTGLYGDGADGGAPARVDFDAVNSAAHVFAAEGVRWQRVFALARAIEAGEGGGVVDAVTIGDQWFPANARALEVVAAHACLDRRVRVRRVEVGSPVRLDPVRAYPLLRRAGIERAAEPAAARPFDGGGGGGGPLRARPAEIASTRDLVAPVWPKVYHFATLMDALAPSDRDLRFPGPVPLRRLGSRNAVKGPWATGSRHRPTAALLTGQTFAARIVSADEPWPAWT